jgi:hypothetical protein
VSDEFGFYRIDALRPGRYRLVVTGDDGRELGTRTVELIGDFVFGQDIRLGGEP